VDGAEKKPRLTVEAKAANNRRLVTIVLPRSNA
jgi:hypothetical protein